LVLTYTKEYISALIKDIQK